MNTIGGKLALLRHTRRAARIELVLAALRERRQAHASRGRVPAGLEQAIGDFTAELEDLHEQLPRGRT